MPHPLIPDIERLASQVAADAGFQVCGVQLLTHRIPMTLQVQLRLADGGDVSLDNCASFSGVLGEALEAVSLIEEAYVLEISSPGIPETLNEDRDFRSFRGFPVCVRYRDAKTGAEAERGDGPGAGDDGATGLPGHGWRSLRKRGEARGCGGRGRAGRDQPPMRRAISIASSSDCS